MSTTYMRKAPSVYHKRQDIYNKQHCVFTMELLIAMWNELSLAELKYIQALLSVSGNGSFKMAEKTMIGLTGLSRKSISNARRSLQQKDYIQCQPEAYIIVKPENIIKDYYLHHPVEEEEEVAEELAESLSRE